MERKTYETLAEQAVDGLDISKADGLVRVDDGEDRWVCEREEWDAAIGDLAERMPLDDDDGSAGATSYGILCGRIGGTMITAIGSSQGDAAEMADMARRAVAAGLLDEDEALARKYLTRK